MIITLPKELKKSMDKGYLEVESLVVFLFVEKGFSNPLGKKFRDTALRDLTKDGRHIRSCSIDAETGDMHIKFA